jgi:hypothetical protein
MCSSLATPQQAQCSNAQTTQPTGQQQTAAAPHLEVVAAQHHCHDVLADVVHITLHRGDDEHACVALHGHVAAS